MALCTLNVKTPSSSSSSSSSSPHPLPKSSSSLSSSFSAFLCFYSIIITKNYQHFCHSHSKSHDLKPLIQIQIRTKIPIHTQLIMHITHTEIHMTNTDTTLTRSIIIFYLYMSQLLLFGKFEYGGGPIFKVVLECYKRCSEPFLIYIYGIQCDFMPKSCWKHSNFENR